MKICVDIAEWRQPKLLDYKRTHSHGCEDEVLSVKQKNRMKNEEEEKRLVNNSGIWLSATLAAAYFWYRLYTTLRTVASALSNWSTQNCRLCVQMVMHAWWGQWNAQLTRRMSSTTSLSKLFLFMEERQREREQLFDQSSIYKWFFVRAQRTYDPLFRASFAQAHTHTPTQFVR